MDNLIMIIKSMKKLLVIALAALCVWIDASAVPAKRVPLTFTQSDGTTITVTMVGDEFNHSFVTTDGLAVSKAASSNDFIYRAAGTNSTVLAHNPADRASAESAFIKANEGNLKYAAVRNAVIAKSPRLKAATTVQRRSQVPHTASPKVPIILVQYSDVSFKDSDPKATFETFMNGAGTSVKKYFTDQSFSKFTPEFDVIGPVTLSNTRAYYGANDSYGNDLRPGDMIKDACTALDSAVNFSQYDNDGDGYVDVVYVIYAGVGEATTSTVPNSIWPHQWDLESANGSDLTLDGVKINRYACGNELESGKVAGIGTFCHEFSHCLGLPDFYDTNGSNFGMDGWSLLDYGCYNNDGYTPCAYTSYEREFMGWMSIETLTPDGNIYTLSNLQDSQKAYRVQNPYKANEYYLLENRQKKGWDLYNATHGLQITHVDYDSTAWENNVVNNTSAHQRMTIFAADNTLSHYNLSGDLYPNNGANTSLTDSTSPAATVFTGKYMSQPITAIAENNGVITFKFGEKNYEVPTALAATNVTDSSFCAHWSSCAGALSYTLRVKKGQDPAKALLLTESFSKFTSESSIELSSSLDSYMANKGWTGSSLYSMTGGLRLGTSSSTGKLKSPSIDVSSSNGAVTLAITSKAYHTDSGITLNVGIGDANGITVNSSNITVATSGSTQYVVLKGNKGANYITLTSTSAKKRPVITGIKIYNGDVSASLAAKSPLKAASETRTEDEILVEGITDTAYVVNGLKDSTQYYYDVKAIYADSAVSKYSSVISVMTDTASTGGVINVFDDSKLIIEGNSLTISSNESSAVYSITGMIVAPKSRGYYVLAPGIYIVKVGAAVRKLRITY